MEYIHKHSFLIYIVLVLGRCTCKLQVKTETLPRFLPGLLTVKTDADGPPPDKPMLGGTLTLGIGHQVATKRARGNTCPN